MIEIALQFILWVVVTVAFAALVGDALGKIAFGNCKVVSVKNEEDE